MDEKQRKIEEKILRKEGELKILKGQLAELERKEKERAKREKQRWDQELLKQIDAVITAARGADFRTHMTQQQITEILQAGLNLQDGLKEEEKHYGDQGGNADR